MSVGRGSRGLSLQLAILALVILLWCGAETGGISRHEADSLRTLADALRREVDQLRHGAPRLLAEARAASEAERWSEVWRLAELLAERRPQAPETASSKALATRADRAERTAQAAAARQAAERRRA